MKRPITGGRFHLERLEETNAAVAYKLVLLTSTDEWRGTLNVAHVDGTTTICWQPTPPPDPPPWLVSSLQGVVRTCWNARQRGDGQPWPAHITRWREPRGL